MDPNGVFMQVFSLIISLAGLAHIILAIYVSLKALSIVPKQEIFILLISIWVVPIFASVAFIHHYLRN
ncbi:MAG: hypothetical protein JW874_10975 [Spirochaetales bacterium]|nr:hypothetical protein [Spirochaetales bacterium]